MNILFLSKYDFKYKRVDVNDISIFLFEWISNQILPLIFEKVASLTFRYKYN